MLIRRFVICVSVATGLGLSAPASAASKPERDIVRVLDARNDSLRNELLKAWLTPPGNADRANSLAVDLMVSEARLEAFGIDRSIITNQISIPELPLEILSERTGLELNDLWRYLRDKTFVIPGASLDLQTRTLP